MKMVTLKDIAVLTTWVLTVGIANWVGDTYPMISIAILLAGYFFMIGYARI